MAWTALWGEGRGELREPCEGAVGMDDEEGTC